MYVPKMRRNLILTYCFYQDEFHIDFFDITSIRQNDREVYQAPATNGTYVLHLKPLVEPPK